MATRIEIAGRLHVFDACYTLLYIIVPPVKTGLKYCHLDGVPIAAVAAAELALKGALSTALRCRRTRHLSSAADYLSQAGLKVVHRPASVTTASPSFDSPVHHTGFICHDPEPIYP